VPLGVPAVPCGALLLACIAHCSGHAGLGMPWLSKLCLDTWLTPCYLHLRCLAARRYAWSGQAANIRSLDIGSRKAKARNMDIASYHTKEWHFA